MAKGVLALAEFAAAFGGGGDGLDEGVAEAVGFELGEAGDGGAAGAGDFVAEGGGVFAGVEDHFGGTEDGLGGEAEGGGAGEAFEDAGVGEGFDDGVDVGGAAAGEAGDGVEEFFGDFIDGADAAEDGAGEVGIGIGGGGAAGEGGGACADEGGGVGHGADDALGGAEPGLEVGKGDAGGDGEVEALAGELGEGLAEGLHVLGFDGEQDDVGVGSGLGGGAGGGLDGEGFAEGFDRGGDGIAESDVEVLFAVEGGADALEESAAHFSAADESEFEHGGSFGWEGASCKLGAG